MSAIGLTFNGVAIYGNGNIDKADAYVNEVKTFDTCGGHVAGTMYHVHNNVIPGCGYNN